MGDIKKTLGGDRLGAGNKNQMRLHNYERSTHDLSESFKSSATVGLLYPCYTNLGLNGDTFEMKIDAGCKTIPTRGPLFGSFKMQVDVFSIPIRLYQGILHNNPLNIGLKMSQVQLPTFEFAQLARLDENYENYAKKMEYSTSSLEKYLGLSGIGINRQEDDGYYRRELTCIYELAYYDIFKNYYANKQEENAYVVGLGESSEMKVTKISILDRQGEEKWAIDDESHLDYNTDIDIDIEGNPSYYLKFSGQNMNMNNIKLTWDDVVRGRLVHTLQEWKNMGYLFPTITKEEIIMDIHPMFTTTGDYQVRLDEYAYNNEQITLKKFPLENIDKMRYKLLAMTELGKHLCFTDLSRGTNLYFDTGAGLPYESVLGYDENGRSVNTHALQGLVCKTYQSDLFNNWVQTEWIDGENGINAITSVQTQDGKFTIDALNLANKVYNMLNRIAVSGGTYQDWQEAVYAEKAVRHAETPIYLGGMSSEVVFDEVVSTAATSEDALGSLGGRGRLASKNGGKIIVKCTEPSIIMAIMSFTPRIEQTQGNAWYRTEINNVDDLHKPALDQIGFQDLLEEQMAWWSTSRGQIGTDETSRENFKPAVGKVPAWINYMTAIDKAYGDFAATEGKAFMVLSRNYTINNTDGTIKDATTYIDPTKYNYAFAYTELDSQNLWVQVYFDIKARRKMSAKQIPNL